jgi:hypothetical protein
VSLRSNQICHRNPPRSVLLHSVVIGVLALDRLRLLERPRRETHAVAFTAWVHIAGKPDAVAAPKSVRARLEALHRALWCHEDEVALVIDLERAALLVFANALNARRVLNIALAHTGSIDYGLLRRVVGVEVEVACLVEVEGRVVGFGTGVARGVLVWVVDEETAVGGLDAAVLEVAAATEGHDAETVVDRGFGVWCRGGDSESCGGGENSGGGELHDGGCSGGCCCWKGKRVEVTVLMRW